MSRIKGRVLVRESGAAVANVIVAVYEIPSGPTRTPVDRRRVGSVATGRDGGFQLDVAIGEDADLLIAIHAPSTGVAGPGVPMHLLTQPGAERGADEEFVIYVSLAVLREHGVPPFSHQRTGPDAEPSVSERVARWRKVAAEARQALTPEVNRRLRLRKAATAQVRRMVGGKPRRGMNAARYVTPGADAAPTLYAARSAGMQRMTRLQPIEMLVHLDEKTLKGLGVPLAADGTFTGTHMVNKMDLENHLATPDPGGLIAIDPIQKCFVEHQAAQVIGPPNGSTPGPGLPAPTTPIDPGATLPEAIGHRLQDLVAAIGTDDPLGVRPDVDQISASLAAEFHGGPADVPATHDFHSLQIAWEDVWTSVLDGQLAKQMAAAYDQVVELASWDTANPDAPDLSEVEELSDFLSLLQDAVAVAGGLTVGFGEPQTVGVHESGGGSAGGGDGFKELQKQPQQPPADPVKVLSRLDRLLTDLASRLAEPYRFEIFDPEGHNFGIVTTYRQTWRPLTYQVGELVGSIPLAPGEHRTYTKKRTVRVTRAQKEVEKALASRHGETAETSRAEAEILRKASYSTNFKMTAEGGFHVAVAHASGGQEYGANQGAESSRTKRDFREAVRKSAQDYRNERTVEVSTENVTTDELTETGDIANTNNELTVTYLFFELQRRFEISERLHRITPVVLIPFEVPAPDQIDEEWLLGHDWILRRVLLDDNLQSALDMLSDTFAGDELAVEVLRVQWETQLDVVRQLYRSSSAQSTAQQAARSALEAALAGHVGSGGGVLDQLKDFDKVGVFDKVGGFMFGGGDDSGQTEALEARRHAAQKALEWAEADLHAISEQLATAVNALQQATSAYTEAVERRLNRRVAIDQLRLHVKQNILYYMQAVWLHEPPDQRYLRIYNKEIEWPQPQQPVYVVVTVSEPNPGWKYGIPGPPNTKLVKVKVQPPVLGAKQRLYEVADLDNLWGFRGNYAIFPLIQRNGLTDFMMQSYLSDYFTAIDPDPLSEIPSPGEAVEIAKCAWDGASAEERQRITDWLVKVLANQRLVSETIVVPTGQLFIEALPGAHPVLEDFKLRHRQADVHRARAEALQADFEALRYAARIAAGTLADPQIQTQIVAAPDVDLAITPGP